MQINWYGHSCFRLTERGFSSIVTDPYDHKTVGFKPLKLKADIITISHKAPGHSFVESVKGSSWQIDGSGEYEIGGVFITAVRTPARKKDSEAARNTLFVFDYDGVNVAHLGDLDRTLTQSEVETLGTVDVALVPVGGGGGLNAAKAAEVISMLEPGFVVPMHYQSKGSKVELDPLEKFLKEMGLNNDQVEPHLKVTRSNIPEETKVVVLESTAG
jgi:L-ascorbate metabolism protein UlaG (beta-lactamase superfamily)